MESCQSRQEFEIGLPGPYTSLVVPTLFEDIYGCEYDRDVEYSQLAKMYPWFKELTELGKASLDQRD